MRKLSLFAVALLSIATLGTAQSVTFTGDVLADFPANQLMIDPGGADVGMPPSLAGGTSGWDIRNLGVSYDDQTDTLYVGIDFAGIAGDADGDGDPANSSAALLVNGGVDLPNMQGSEGFAFAMDLDDDGLLDFVAGIPLGADLSGFTVATYDNTTGVGSSSPTVDPYSRFGTTLPSNIGSIFASPSAAAPDIEFTIPNFSELLAQFGMGNDGDFGIFAFAGSLEDDGIGEDFVQDIIDVGTAGPCVPIPNQYEIRNVQGVPNGNAVTTRYGVMRDYGCCVLYSLLLSPAPIVISSVPGTPSVLVSDLMIPSSLFVVDNGVPDTQGLAVACKEATAVIPDGLPSGTKIYAQILAYPAIDASQTFFTSNVVTYTQP
jgi:hypothetical protein